MMVVLLGTTNVERYDVPDVYVQMAATHTVQDGKSIFPWQMQMA